MTFPASSMLVKIAFGLCIAALFFHLISFPSHYWIDQNGVSVGLFELCSSGTCYRFPEAKKTDNLKVITAMEIIALLEGVACLVLTICFLFVGSLATKTVKNVCMVLAFVAAILIFIAVKDEQVVLADYGWSFILEIVAALLYVATGIVFVVDNVVGS